MNSARNYLLIIIAGVLFFIPFLGGVHLFDWDEINFAEISREMIVTGNYLRPEINFQPFWEKPPLFFWLQVLAMKIFGIGEFSTRFPNAIAGIISLLIIYDFGKKLFNKRFGLIWSLAYFGSILPHLYFQSGIIDPVFNLFIFLALYCFIRMYWQSAKIRQSRYRPWFWLVLSGVFTGLAILTKGPAGLLILLLTWGVYWITKKFRFYVSISRFIVITLIALTVAFTWFGIDIILHGPWFVKTFTAYQLRLFSTQDAGHGGFPGYHFVVLLIGCFPASVFAIRAFFKMKPYKKDVQADFRKWMIILFWVVLILFSIVQSKIVHYSSLAYFPLTFLAALTIDRILDRKLYCNPWMQAGIAAIGSIYGIVTIALPFIGKNIGIIEPLFSKDPFVQANLQADVHWTLWASLPGLLILVITILSLVYLHRGRLARGVILLFAGTAVYINLTLYFFIGRIEGYSQNAAVEFCESLQGKDCYVMTSGYKSYVPYFYARTEPNDNDKYTDKDWLLTGNIDKDVYIIAKINRVDELYKYNDLQKLGEKNGFIFFVRRAGN